MLRHGDSSVAVGSRNKLGGFSIHVPLPLARAHMSLVQGLRADSAKGFVAVGSCTKSLYQILEDLCRGLNCAGGLCRRRRGYSNKPQNLQK